ncbi:MAG: homoserine kinase [Spirochaetales bacterium]|nr:MAG: homoserine kinase [Spirochaetales bacterium]
MVRVFAPATSANLNVGFDNLGVALKPLSGSLGDEVLIAESLTDTIIVTGPYASEIRGPNIIERALECVRNACGRRTPVSLELRKGVPIGSGLGSSAASVVAAVKACNEYYGRPLDDPAGTELMGELETELSGGRHWDNILPCALGGLRLGESALPVPTGWIWLVVYPCIRLETRAMRALLPDSIPLRDAVEHAARLGKFVDALHRSDGSLAASLMVDPIIEPQRSQMIPGFESIRDGLVNDGAIAAGISGSGPTIFAIFDDSAAAETALGRAKAWVVNTPGAFATLCEVDSIGARFV